MVHGQIESLDISAATGELVYIGLRHHDVTDVYLLSIDNVSVTSSTMSNEDFTLHNIDYSFDQETKFIKSNFRGDVIKYSNL